MKKFFIVIITSLAVLGSCGRDIIESEKETDDVTGTAIAFNLTANHPDATKSVKSGWEDGDAIFVFFNNVAAPCYLKMSYNGRTWTSAEMNGSTVTVGALGLKNGDRGSMRAVFLPFGSDATVSASGTDFVFNKTWYAYYLTATLDYIVADNTVSGAFNMTIPDDYVQFFVEDASAADEAYMLGCDAVIPTGVASVSADGTITETNDKTPADDMPGYAYNEGYLFSGKINGSYSSTRWDGSSAVEAHAYYFAKTKVGDGTRHDYFVSDKTLTRHSAIKLPANDDIYSTVNTGKWVPVGSGIAVRLFQVTGSGSSETFSPLGKWYTCNYGQSVPEAPGTLYTFDAATALGVTLPTKNQIEDIYNNCTETWLTVHGIQGAVIKAGQGFLFLPAQEIAGGDYWSSTELGDQAYHFYFHGSFGHDMNVQDRTRSCAVRPIQSNLRGGLDIIDGYDPNNGFPIRVTADSGNSNECVSAYTVLWENIDDPYDTGNEKITIQNPTQPYTGTYYWKPDWLADNSLRENIKYRFSVILENEYERVLIDDPQTMDFVKVHYNPNPGAWTAANKPQVSWPSQALTELDFPAGDFLDSYMDVSNCYFQMRGNTPNSTNDLGLDNLFTIGPVSNIEWNGGAIFMYYPAHDTGTGFDKLQIFLRGNETNRVQPCELSADVLWFCLKKDLSENRGVLLISNGDGYSREPDWTDDIRGNGVVNSQSTINKLNDLMARNTLYIGSTESAHRSRAKYLYIRVVRKH